LPDPAGIIKLPPDGIEQFLRGRVGTPMMPDLQQICWRMFQGADGRSVRFLGVCRNQN
jgi:hypothetical protein